MILPVFVQVVQSNGKDKLMQKIRYLDKLVDDMAKGETMEKILRK